ncbi:MAG TPA: class I tRNA ligase family protein [Solirubrobacteraceae bacterium]|jgi:methionyl-tRNA synthetase
MIRDPLWITATPPTPNGDLHVGHMAGPYIASDVLRRFLSADGRETLLTTGIDEHQNYVVVRAEAAGCSPQELGSRYGESIRKTWSRTGVQFDRIVLPDADAGYACYVERFFERLVAAGDIVPRNRPLPYCKECSRWLFDGYLLGICPYCDTPCNGGACETCGRPNDCGDILEPHCRRCRLSASVRPCTRYYLPLVPFTDRLEKFWARVEMPPRLQVLCETILADGLPEMAVSFPADWGIPVPIDGFRHHVISPLCEMAPGYLLERSPDGELPITGPVQFFGFDNGYFHALLIPALLMAYDDTIPMPVAFRVNEMYRLEESKFSTSRQHVVQVDDALGDAGVDALRFHVFSDRPQGRETSFSLRDLEHSHEWLRSIWNGWLERLLAIVHADYGGVIPDVRPSGAAWSVLGGRLERIALELREAYEVVDARRVIALLNEVVLCATDFGYVHEPLSQSPRRRGERDSAIAAQLAVASALAAWSAPIVPTGADRLASLLGVRAGRPISAAIHPPAAGTRVLAMNAPIFGL